jgi:hypothetical protein
MPKRVKLRLVPQTGLLSTLSSGAWVLVLVTESALAVRLLFQRLWRLFPFFCIYLVADVSRSVVLWKLGNSPNTKMYRAVWIATEPWAIFLDLLVALELYKSLYRAYPGIHRFARIVVAVGILVAAAIAFGTLSIDIRNITWSVPDVQRIFLLKRIVSSVIAVLLAVTMTVFPRAECAVTVIQHGWLLTALFTARALGFFLADIGINSDLISLPFLAIQCILYLLWLVWLSPPAVRRAPRSVSEIERTEKWNRELLDATRWLIR